MQMMKMNVTPEMASSWLSEANTANRTLSYATVSRYASDMIDGNWQDTHQNAIAFYSDGTLADGQHRLSAVVKAGVIVPMFVALGLDRASACAIDQGRSRKMSDVMSIMGVIKNGKYQTATVAMMNIIRRAEGDATGNPTTHEMARAIRRMDGGISFAHECMTTSQGKLQSATFRAALATAYYFADNQSLRDFSAVWCSGMPERPKDATVITLRNRLLLVKDGGGASERVNKYKMSLRFIKAYGSEKILTMAKYGSELVFRTGAFDE